MFPFYSYYSPQQQITTTLSDPTFVAGNFVSGKLDMECRADRGLGIGILMVELFAIQDHSATPTFLHSRRLFQGPGLPPSNAVQAYTMLGDQEENRLFAHLISFFHLFCIQFGK
ncbi:hypothetical protein BYT27DRAFT_7199922, partial [Phlegmacium glaucopus]